MAMKNLFLFSLSAMMLSICCICVYYIWNSERTQQAAMAEKEAQIISEVDYQCKLKKKRQKLKEYYANEFTVNYKLFLDKSKAPYQQSLILEEIEKLKGNLLQDGFSRAEIEKLSTAGYCEADEYWKERAKQVAMKELELNNVIKTGNVVVEFYAEWCGPCQQLKPIFAKVAADTPHVTFTKVNADEIKNSNTLTNLNLKGVPTLVFYKDGKEIDRKVGALNEATLRDLIKKTFRL